MPDSAKTMIPGLAYVGIPLAVALAEHGAVVGDDPDTQRIGDIRRWHDNVDSDNLAALSRLTADRLECQGGDNYTCTAPTRIDGAKQPAKLGRLPVVIRRPIEPSLLSWSKGALGGLERLYFVQRASIALS